MTKITRRNLARGGALGLAGSLAAPALAQSGKRRWRMVTSWPRRLPGPGMSAERVAERISALSGGRLQVTVRVDSSKLEMVRRRFPQAILTSV